MGDQKKTTILRAFNTHFFEFVDDLVRIFPEKQDIAVARSTFEWFKKANPTSILKAWHFFVYEPYKEVIHQGDITFFFHKDYAQDLTYLKNSNEIIKIIDTLREPVSKMNEENQAHSMKYMQNLSKLADAYTNI